MSSLPSLLIVEDDRALADQLRWALKSKFDVSCAPDAVEGARLVETDPDVILLDLRLPPSHEPGEGLKLVGLARSRNGAASIVVLTGEEDRALAQRALELGAYDYFRKPADPGELSRVLFRAAERHRILQENSALREQMAPRPRPGRMIGESPPMRALYRAIDRVAATDATVLILGESGAGKELVAGALVEGSPRARKPFVAVNCSALPETLAESELFGYERGAFTGAGPARPGKFEVADGGTLFLDEIGTLSPAVQAKLLRALETREVVRLGASQPRRVDIRLLAATNEDLPARAREGSFREDLLFRLNTVTLRVPPLRERGTDIGLLLDHFARQAGARYGRAPKRFSPGAIEALSRHSWPGNVRELAHLVEMLTLMVDEPEIVPEHLPALSRRATSEVPHAPAEGLPFAEAVARYERELLNAALSREGGVKARAARRLSLDPNQMKYLCRKYGL